MKKAIPGFSLLLVFFSAFLPARTQSLQKGETPWLASVERKDGKRISFQLIQAGIPGKPAFYVQNGAERIKVAQWRQSDDSVFFALPAFEVSFRARIIGRGKMEGEFIKRTSGTTQYWPFLATAHIAERFGAAGGNARQQIAGQWEVRFTRPDGTTRKAIAILKQEGNHLSGTFLTPSADYRYLDGIVSGDSLKLSSFDGDNIRLFEAKVFSADSIAGLFYNGYVSKEPWVAIRKERVALPEAEEPTRLREGETGIHFRFRDLEGNWVSPDDARFRNKVVIIQLMGSWCANCLDETRFLVDLFNKHHPEGLEMIALAYEFTTDEARSKASIGKFVSLYHIPYPILLTGVTASDEKKAEKTIPQLTVIRSFPTTLVIDRKGTIREIKTSFYGPGSGKFYEEYKQAFESLVSRLLDE